MLEVHYRHLGKYHLWIKMLSGYQAGILDYQWNSMYWILCSRMLLVLFYDAIITHFARCNISFTACNCNLHSDKCIFSSSLYENSGKKSGGVCINCRHNTAGVNCQTCRDGYYRNMAVPMSHRQACRGKSCLPQPKTHFVSTPWFTLCKYSFYSMQLQPAF